MRTHESLEMLKALRVEKPTTVEEWQAKTFIENVAWARDCGFSLVCAECGVGVSDESDEHEDWCEMEAKNEEDAEAFAERLASIQKKDP